MRKFPILLILALLLAGYSSPLSAQEQEEEAVATYMEPLFHEEFREYYTYQTMMESIARLEAEHSDIMRVVDISQWSDLGSTYGGRQIPAIKISDDPQISDPTEPKLLLVGAHHAREWMSYEVPMYFLHYLLDNYGKAPFDDDDDGLVNEDPIDSIDNDGDGLIDEDGSEARATYLVDHREIWIVPMLNPDGVEVDMEMFESGSGSWRKNIRDNNGNGQFESELDGVDLNRNYPYMWNSRLDPQTGKTMDSAVPSSDNYRGPPDNFDDDGDGYGICPEPRWIDRPGYIDRDFDKCDEDPVDGIDNDGDGLIDEDKDGGFSEPETQAIRELMKRLDSDGKHYNRDSDLDIAITYHSYSDLVIYPWGYTSTPTSDNGIFEELAAAFVSYNGYEPGQGTSLYPVSGDFDDWMYGSHGVLSFTFELNSAEDGGFHPAPDMIIPTALENLGANLHAAEMAGVAGVAKELSAPSLDIGLPTINHTQPNTICSEVVPYFIEVEVQNAHNLDNNGLQIHYRIGGAGSYKSISMKQMGESRFVATIPPLPGGSEVQYYITGLDVHGLEVSYPLYAEAESLSYFVDVSLAASLLDMGIMLFMVFFMFGFLYSGLVKFLKMAMDAEKVKELA